MSILDIFKRKQKPPLKYATFVNPYDVLLGNDSTSFAAIDLICSSFSSLSFDFYSFITREKTDHDLKQLLLDPNSETSRFDFFYHSAKNIFTHGNCFWYKFDMEGKIVSLFLINPSDVRVQRDSQTNEKIFYYNGTVYNRDKILHIPSRFGFDGLIGKSIFTVCRDIFQNASNLDLYVKNSFNNSVGKRLVIDLSGVPDLDNDGIEAYKTKFLRDYTGVSNSGTPLLKRRGINYETIDGFNSNQAQQLEENRRFGEREIAKLLRVPIELLSGSKDGRDLETIYNLFLDGGVKPLATQFEQAINKFLLSPLERSSVYFEFSYNSLLKTSLQTRVDTYVKQLNNGILSVNEIRQKENLPNVEAGDYLFVPANVMPLKQDVINSYMAGAKLKEFELQEKESNSKEFHEENPPIGDDRL
jgi:HK97 family phage portal protein